MLTERQQEILDKSIEIISRKGIQGLTIKNLSKEIGISEPAIYRHFESKTDILLTILNNFMEMSVFMNEAILEMQETAIEKISFMFSKIIEIFAEEPSHISVVFSEEIFKNDEILKAKIIELMSLKEQTVEKVIKQGQENGEVRTDIDYKTLALIVMGALRFTVKQWDLRKQQENLKDEGDKLINALTLILKS
jgi:AcrR family transcriptional regulator